MKKTKTKGIKYWDDKLWPVFSRYIRLRDALALGGVFDEDGEAVAECITCYTRKSVKKLQAGHWIGRRHKMVKYDEHNVHAQCGQCNKWGAGEPQFYEDRIVELYGEAERDRLRQGVYQTRKFTPFELEEMYNHYKLEVERLEVDLGLKQPL